MRTALAALLVAAALTTAVGSASAADGCSYGYYGNIVCYPGAQPGVPYRYGYYGGGGYGYYGDEPYYYRRHYDRGAAIALGVIGAAAAAIAGSRYHHRRHYRNR